MDDGITVEVDDEALDIEKINILRSELEWGLGWGIK